MAKTIMSTRLKTKTIKFAKSAFGFCLLLSLLISPRGQAQSTTSASAPASAPASRTPSPGETELAPQVFDLDENGVAGTSNDSGPSIKIAPVVKNPVGGQGTPEERAEEVLKLMTLQEKFQYIGGQQNRIMAIQRLGLPEIMMSDGRLGLRKGGMKSTAYPSQTCVASTWNTELTKAMGVSFGKDFRVRGFHIALAPWVDIIRDPRGGRNFEAYSEDPYLTGKIGTAQVQGMQSQGVLATLTCYAVNNQETARNFFSSEIDDRTFHELYLPSFKMAIQEGEAGCVMSAFNRINGVRCTESVYINETILRKELGFKGILMSDWTAVRDIAAVNGGLDLEMPFGKVMNPEALQKAMDEGKIKVATIDEKVRRILRTIIAAGFLERVQELAEIAKEDVGTKDLPGSAEASLNIAREGIVLLKNDGGILPLDPSKIKKVAVIGENATGLVHSGGGGSSIMNPHRKVTVLDGLKAEFFEVTFTNLKVTLPESNTVVTYNGPVKMEVFKNRHLQGKPALVKEVADISLAYGEKLPAEGFPKEYSVRWTAKMKAPFDGYTSLAATSNDGVNVFLDGKPMVSDWRIHRRVLPNQGLVHLVAGSEHELKVEYFYAGAGGANLNLGWSKATAFDQALESAKNSDAVVLCAGFNYRFEGEGLDRDFSVDPFQQMLLSEIPKCNPKTVVLLFGGGAIDCNMWLDKTTALFHAGYPGQEGGTALAELITGKVNPSGKLPFTMPRKIEDHPSHPFFLNKEDMLKNRVVYGEGVMVGYRGYDAKGINPLYPFGYGLSYTSFAYGDLKINETPNGKVMATFSITNSGSREGAEIAQLYVVPSTAKVQRPPQELKGFSKVHLKAGETKLVSIELNRDAFAYWNTEAQHWVVEEGSYGIHVGASSRDIRLKGKYDLK